MSDTPQTVTCPKCGEEIVLEFTAKIPDDQIVKVRLESESKFIAAECVGEMILAQSECLRLVAKNLGGNVAVFLTAAKVSDCVVELEFAVVDAKEPIDPSCKELTEEPKKE
jgi:hypothetical protein